MKKNLFYCFICLTALFFTGCSNDDDSSSDKDLLVGNWDIIQISYSYQEEGNIEPTVESFDTTMCEPQPTANFKEDGSATMSDYTIDVDENGDTSCTTDGVMTGSWEKISSNNYTITFDGETIENMEVNFSNKNNTVVLIANDGIDGEIDSSSLTLKRK